MMNLVAVFRGTLESLGVGSDVNAFLLVFGLALARVALTVSLSPFLGGNAVSAPAKMGLSMMLTLLLLPELRSQAPLEHIDTGLFIVLLLKELTVGLTLGVLSQLIFYAVQTAGALMDTARGMDQPGLTTPQLSSNASVLAQLKFQMALVLFLTINGHLFFLRGLATSFERLPLRGFVHFDSQPALQRIGLLSGQLFVVSLQLAAPVMVALFLVDICFAALGKVAPRMNIYTESQPVKALVGLVILFFALALIAARLPQIIGSFLQNVFALLASLG
jgi:flagellar biosynthetic protein FliR